MRSVLLRRLRSSGADGYAAVGIKPKVVADFENSYFRKASGLTTFDNLLTHSRAGNATMVDSDGKLKWAPHNLVAYSGDFSNAAWLKNVSLTLGSLTTAPDGTNSAQLVNFVTQFSNLTQVGLLSNNGAKAKVGVWIKRISGNTQLYLRGQDGALLYASIINVTDGWAYYESEFTHDGTNAIGFTIQDRNASGFGQIAIWQPRVYRSDLGGMVNNPDTGTSYVPTTSAARYLPRRGHHVWDGSAWVNEGLLLESAAATNNLFPSIPPLSAVGNWNAYTGTSAGGQADPIGGTSASLFTATGVGDQPLRNTFTQSINTNYCLWALVGIGTARWVRLRGLSVSGGGAPAVDGAWFDLTNGVVGTKGSGVTTTGMLRFSSGYWLIWMAYSTPAVITNNLCDLAWSNADATTAQTIGQTGIAYHCQLEVGSIPSSLIPTTSATVTRAAETLTIAAANMSWPPYVETTGTELVTNGGFTTDTNWTKGTGWTIGSGVATKVAGVAGAATQPITVTAGNCYLATYTITRTAGTITPFFSGGVSGAGVGRSASGTYSNVIVAGTGNTTLELYADAAFAGTIDNVTIKQVNPLAVVLAIDGKVNHADINAYNVAFFRWGNIGARFEIDLDTTGAKTGEPAFIHDTSSIGGAIVISDGADTAYPAGLNVPYNLAMRVGSTFVSGAHDGTLTSLQAAVAYPNLSAQILNMGFTFNGTIRSFREWDADIGDRGIVEATGRVWSNDAYATIGYAPKVVADFTSYYYRKV